jgi:hypothetical protein
MPARDGPESKLQRAYESTARSMDGHSEVKEIANRWLAIYLLRL